MLAFPVNISRQFIRAWMGPDTRESIPSRVANVKTDAICLSVSARHHAAVPADAEHYE
jgi:hypothetical protein